MVSVAIPAFKARFLARAIQSVLGQTYAQFELIIVNDASPEDIKSVVGQYSDRRIQYFENEVNLGKDGIVRNWNECLRHAKGELFVLFSDDDVYEPAFLEEMISLTKKYPDADIFHCRTRIIDEQENTVAFAPTCPEFESAIDFIWHRTQALRMHFVADFLCRTSALVERGGFVDLPHGWGADDLTWFQLAQRGGIGYTQKALFKWRRSDINISRIGEVAPRLDALNTYERKLETILRQWTHSSEGDRDLASDALRQVPRWVASLKSDLLLAGPKAGLFTTMIRATSRWMQYRKQYHLTFRMLLRAIGEMARKVR